jgi:glycosyltransferase involved in cell wall biosynthesis
VGASHLNIVVAVRCYNEEKNIERFMRGYDFADTIVVSDGGSTDNSVQILKRYPKVKLLHFTQQETMNGQTWNPDAPHMNYVLDHAKGLNPDWIIFDDMDDVPNHQLRNDARTIFDQMKYIRAYQINAFRLYLWGDAQYFPWLNRDFDPAYKSLWAWNPSEIDICADESIRHGTLVGLSSNPYGLEPPHCLLHKSYSLETIDAKLERYNALGLPMLHPLETNGELKDLPEWAVE